MFQMFLPLFEFFLDLGMMSPRVEDRKEYVSLYGEQNIFNRNYSSVITIPKAKIEEKNQNI